jgi:hypothetical protein
VGNQCMHRFDGERVNACMHSVAGMGLAEGHFSQFRGELSSSKACFGIRESPKTQGKAGRREYHYIDATT